MPEVHIKDLGLLWKNRAFCPWQVPCTPPATWQVPGPSAGFVFPEAWTAALQSGPRPDKIEYLAPAQVAPGNPAPHWLRTGRSKPSLHVPNQLRLGFTLARLPKLEGGAGPSQQVGPGSHLPRRPSGWSPSVPVHVEGGKHREAGWVPSHPSHPDSYRPEALCLKVPTSYARVWGPREPQTTLSARGHPGNTCPPFLKARSPEV